MPGSALISTMRSRSGPCGLANSSAARQKKSVKLVDAIVRRFAVPKLTRNRIWFAFAVATITDAVQFSLGPVGWLFVDEGLDIVAMVLTSATLGFHMLLLPTFVIELFPVADMLPTWTACTAAVVMLRKRAQQPLPPVVAVPPRISDTPPPGPAETSHHGVNERAP
jgi:hypothetical protein